MACFATVRRLMPLCKKIWGGLVSGRNLPAAVASTTRGYTNALHPLWLYCIS